MAGIGSVLLLGAMLSGPSSPHGTDFGIREVTPPSVKRLAPLEAYRPAARTGSFDLRSAADFGSRWGTVTSTRRSFSRNRAVGGAANSFHLSGRAIDIARRPGVSHARIEAAFRAAGYYLIESLDEGDHSHFAFGTIPSPAKPRWENVQTASAEQQDGWRVVSAPGYTQR